jgi:hypothetical protein
MQLATWTRPDIPYSLSVLSKFFSNPARRHWTLARRVVNYLKSSQDSVLFLSSEQGGPVTDSPMLKTAGNSELLTFTDSDFASCEETRKSRSGACIFFCNSLIHWKSGKQNHVSSSATEAEFYALLEGITKVECLQDVIHFAYKVDKRIFNCKNTPIFCDNSSAGKIASSIESIARTKHIEVAHLWFQQEVAKKGIKVHYANTENQAADIFTKSLARPLFVEFKKTLGLISSKEMCPVISLYCLTRHTKSRGGQLRNRFQNFETRFCPQVDVPDISHLKLQRRNSENQVYSILNPASDSDLEEGINEKPRHESEDGVLFTLQR